MAKGLIVKALSGFYYVREEETGQLYECRGRGLFRKDEVSPFVGDSVIFQIEANEKGYITQILERKNRLIRPSIANIDQVLLVFSVQKPAFNQSLLDRFLAIIEAHGIPVTIVLTKLDLLEEKHAFASVIEYYEGIGYQVIQTSKKDPQSMETLKAVFKDKLSVFAGQSGVGKSSLLNAMDANFQLNVGEISKALGRGRHTTRHVELFPMSGGLIADTPGFSSLDFQEFEIDEVELAHSFVDFFELGHDCKFNGCLHINEPNCYVKKQLGTNAVFDERYKNYQNFHLEIKGLKPTYQKKNK